MFEYNGKRCFLPGEKVYVVDYSKCSTDVLKPGVKDVEVIQTILCRNGLAQYKIAGSEQPRLACELYATKKEAEDNRDAAYMVRLKNRRTWLLSQVRAYSAQVEDLRVSIATRETYLSHYKQELIDVLAEIKAGEKKPAKRKTTE